MLSNIAPTPSRSPTLQSISLLIFHHLEFIFCTTIGIDTILTIRRQKPPISIHSKSHLICAHIPRVTARTPYLTEHNVVVVPFDLQDTRKRKIQNEISRVKTIIDANPRVTRMLKKE